MKKIVFGALVAAALTGCTGVNTVENADKSGQRNMVSDQRVIASPSMNRRVAVVGVNTAMTAGGLLKAQVELENRTHSTHRFLYHFEWYDSAGMQVNNILSANVSDQIEAKDTKFVFSIAPNPDCKDFKLKLIDVE